MSLRINPESPTPKFSHATPDATSLAYYLPSPAARGQTSFDDCKQRNTPTLWPIPPLERGTMVEMKAGGWGWELDHPNSAGFRQFEDQIRNQNAAVVAEGRKRQIYYCIESPKSAAKAQEKFESYKNSHFIVCPRGH